jgi:hypothetical protein
MFQLKDEQSKCKKEIRTKKQRLLYLVVIKKNYVCKIQWPRGSTKHKLNDLKKNLSNTDTLELQKST